MTYAQRSAFYRLLTRRFVPIDFHGHDSEQLETTDEQCKAETGREYEYCGK